MGNKNSVIIVGSGLAGLNLALELAKSKIHSVVLSKASLTQTNSWRAQGGLAAAISKSDSIEDHVSDTLTAGAGLCHPHRVEKMISMGPELIHQIIREGMNFDRSTDGSLEFAQEGGHHSRRVIHVDDRTGQALHQFVLESLQNKYSDYCSLLPHATLFQVEKDEEGNFISHCLKKNEGKDQGEVQSFKSNHLVLATGGVGKCFQYTSNWEGATADGLKIAFGLGAHLINCEMVQFHPTCLYHPKARNFLITEALRGEGARLLNHKGEAFARNYHEMAELAPRDIVSQAIEQEMKSNGVDNVFLDISFKSKTELMERFPTIYKKCAELGIHIDQEAIPVVPAAHYFCGGVETKTNLVESRQVLGLFLIGETACTGLHGANRLASNSLLECLVSSKLCAEEIKLLKPELEEVTSPLKPHQTPDVEDEFLINALWEESRSIMWNFVGIRRSNKRLQQALEKIQLIEKQLKSILSENKLSKDLLELQNIIFFSKACIESALTRKESRGCHFTVDYPKKETEAYNTVYTIKGTQLQSLKEFL